MGEDRFMERAQDRNFIRNVGQLLSKKGMMQKDLAKLIGCTRQHLNAVMKGRVALTKDFEDKIAEALQVSVQSLHQRSLDVKDPTSQNQTPGRVAYKNVPLLLIKGGGGKVYVSEIDSDFLSFRRDWLYQKGDPDHIGAIIAHGGAMEGRIPDGATVLIDQSQTDLVDNAVYLVAYRGEPLIRQVSLDSAGEVHLVTKNGESKVDQKFLQILGRCVWYGKDLI